MEDERSCKLAACRGLWSMDNCANLPASATHAESHYDSKSVDCLRSPTTLSCIVLWKSCSLENPKNLLGDRRVRRAMTLKRMVRWLCGHNLDCGRLLALACCLCCSLHMFYRLGTQVRTWYTLRCCSCGVRTNNSQLLRSQCDRYVMMCWLRQRGRQSENRFFMRCWLSTPPCDM